jgi:iron complex outermembrane receptor protein
LFSLGTHQSAAAIEYGLFLDSQTNEILSRNEVNFKNEQSLKWVGGWKSEKENLSAEFSIFGNMVFNYFYLKPGGITQNIRGAYPFYRYAQTNALFLGSDASLNRKLNDHLTISPRASFIFAEDITNRDFLPFIPANRLELFIRNDRVLKNGKSMVFVELRNRYVFRQFRAPRVINPESFLNYQNPQTIISNDKIFDFMAAPDGYFLTGISAGLNIKSEKIRYDIRLSADNLFNESYREYTNRFRYFANEPGRNIFISIKTTF